MARKKYTEYEKKVIKEIGNAIKVALKAKKLQQKELSLITGLSRSTISDYVTGKTLISLENFKKINEALDLGNEHQLNFISSVHKNKSMVPPENIPNIYTILDKIKFEEQIKRIAKINNIEDPYLLMQGVFKIVQEFHMEILNNKSNTGGGK